MADEKEKDESPRARTRSVEKRYKNISATILSLGDGTKWSRDDEPRALSDSDVARFRECETKYGEQFIIEV